MFADLKPYAQYRRLNPTGTAPAHWGARALRSLITPRTERNRPDLPLLSVARERGVFIRTDDDQNHNVIPEDLTNYKVARAGDLVINKMKAWQGSLGLAPCNGLVSPAYFVYRFSLADRFYGQALLRSRPYVSHFGAASDGVRVGQWDLSIPRLREIPVLEPPTEEQAAIVRYLVHANRRIDQAIAIKRKLIRLLEEQKQVIIHQAVTRGLDPNVPMKDSGIPWLGETPAHWQLRKLRSLFSGQGSGTTPPDPDDYGDEIPWIMSGDLNDSVVTTTKRSVTRAAVSRLSALKTYPAGSLVVAMYGATIGKTGIADMDAATNQACCVFYNPRLGVNVAFVHMAVRVAKPGLLISAFGGGQPNVNADIVKQLKIPVPPTDEQRRIVEHILRSTASLETTKAGAQSEIGLLREFRSRLTADVVTGQLDVRAIAATLPYLDPDELVGEDSVDAAADDDLDEVTNEFLEES